METTEVMVETIMQVTVAGLDIKDSAMSVIEDMLTISMISMTKETSQI